jgi:hypothetical protein
MADQYGQGQGDPGGGGTGGQGEGYGEEGSVAFLYEIYANSSFSDLIQSSGYDYPSREEARDAASVWAKAQTWYANVTTVLYVIVKANKTGFNSSTYEIQPPYLEPDTSGGPDTRTDGIWWEGKTYFPGDPGYDEAKKAFDANQLDAAEGYGDYLKDGKLYWFGFIKSFNPDNPLEDAVTGVPVARLDEAGNPIGELVKYKTDRPTYTTLRDEYKATDLTGYFDMTRGGSWVKVYPPKEGGTGGTEAGSGGGGLILLAAAMLCVGLFALGWWILRQKKVVQNEG